MKAFWVQMDVQTMDVRGMPSSSDQQMSIGLGWERR